MKSSGYMTKFKAGWLFDEVAGKRKELFKILMLQCRQQKSLS